MVKIKRIDEVDFQCILFNPEHKKVGEIRTENQLNDVRCQIKENQLEGYFIQWGDSDTGNTRRSFINTDGRFCDDVPTKCEDYLWRLVK